MSKHVGLFWLKDDFRFKRNLALIEATKNHDQVVAFYLYKKQKFESGCSKMVGYKIFRRI